jgi:uncharacterized glyoxalase superfamily protein PhnB
MRQLTCTGPGAVEWREVPEPRLEGDSDALVRPLAVARCDIDLPLMSGAFPIREPFALGHECVADVVALGDRVRGLEIGQRVVVAFQVSCGACRCCAAGHTANCDASPVLSDFGMQPLSCSDPRQLGGPPGASAAELERIAHVSLPFGKDAMLMASDIVPSLGQRLTVGNNFYISLAPDSAVEARRLFQGLSAGGTVEMALQRTQWAESFATLTDRFGVQWMINYAGDARFVPPPVA